MQRIAVLLLCTGMWSAQAAADPCEAVGNVVGGFAGGVVGWGVATVAGPPTGWVSAGLYGAGITVASLSARAAGEVGCNNFSENFKRIGDMYCMYSQYNYDCTMVNDVAASLYADFVLCPSCTWDEVFGAYFLDDESRQNWLRGMQYGKTGFYSMTTQVIPRDYIGTVSSSVSNSYFLGLQAGFAVLRSRSMYINLK